MQELIATNSKDFTVTEQGDAFITQTKVAELCGVTQSTISDFTKNKTHSLKLNKINQLSAESAFYTLAHYAEKGRPEAVKSLIKIGQAGMKAYIYHQAGYTLKAEIQPQFNIPKTLGEALLLAGKLAQENIAELTGKLHAHVLRDIDKTIKELEPLLV